MGDPTNSIKVLKEMLQRTKKTMKTTKYTYGHWTDNNIHTKGYTQSKHNKSPSLHEYGIGVTRGQLPQTAGSLGLNGGGAAAAVPPKYLANSL